MPWTNIYPDNFCLGQYLLYNIRCSLIIREVTQTDRDKDLQINFKENIVLDRISWFITPKSRIGLVGDNGAGKTTLLRVIAGETEYDGGSLTIPRDHRVGYLPQDLVEIDEMPPLTISKGAQVLRILP